MANQLKEDDQEAASFLENLCYIDDLHMGVTIAEIQQLIKDKVPDLKEAIRELLVKRATLIEGKLREYSLLTKKWTFSDTFMDGASEEVFSRLGLMQEKSDKAEVLSKSIAPDQIGAAHSILGLGWDPRQHLLSYNKLRCLNISRPRGGQKNPLYNLYSGEDVRQYVCKIGVTKRDLLSACKQTYSPMGLFICADVAGRLLYHK